MINWRELRVSGQDDIGSLGELVDSSYAGLSGIDGVTAAGAISGWHQHFISAPGENPDWDTPHDMVNWAGFSASLEKCGHYKLL